MPSDPCEVIDIWAGAEWPACVLSNLAAHPFVVDGVACASMEGFLQSLKYGSPEVAAQVRQLAGRRAKRAGRRSGAAAWVTTGELHWRGAVVGRRGEAYQRLLDRAYAALFSQCGDAAGALLATGDARLLHSRGRRDPAVTALTADELCERLTAIRSQLVAARLAGER